MKRRANRREVEAPTPRMAPHTNEDKRRGWYMVRPSSISESRMFYRKWSVVAGVGLAAVTLLNLHGHAPPGCNPKIALCAVWDALYLPDDPPPKPAP
jgi:hypothetical protein